VEEVMADENKSNGPEKQSVKARLHQVVSRVFHNGKLFRRGAKISLTAEEAKPLGAAVKPVEEEK
jgi:hypothetical protein